MSTTELVTQKDNLRILVTVIQMFRDRKYQFPDKYQPNDLLTDPTTILKMPGILGNKVTDLRDLIKDDRGTPVFIHLMKDEEPFSGSKHKESVAKDVSKSLNPAIPSIKPGNKDLEIIVQHVHLMIIFNHHRNPNKKYETTKFEQEAFPIYNYEVWAKHRLRFNVTKHFFVGKHVKLTPEEATEYRKEFNLTSMNMQKITWDDPVNRYYYGQPDDVYRIYRIQQGINYRLVTKKTLASLNTK